MLITLKLSMSSLQKHCFKNPELHPRFGDISKTQRRVCLGCDYYVTIECALHCYKTRTGFLGHTHNLCAVNIVKLLPAS